MKITTALYGLALPIAFLVTASSARADPRQGTSYPSCGLASYPQSSFDLVNYNGGPLITNLRLYAVFWGPNVDSTVVNQIGGFYSTLVSGQYTSWLSVDYHASGMTIFQGTYAGSYTITPFNTSTALTDANIQEEFRNQIGHGTLPNPDANTLFMVHLPPGISVTFANFVSCTNFCAYHGNSAAPGGGWASYSTYPGYAYAVMPDLSQCTGPCWNYDYIATPFDAITRVASHELAEAITDVAAGWAYYTGIQAYGAWNGNSTSNEIGDWCTSSFNSIILPGTSYVVQKVWSRLQNACISTSTDHSSYGQCCPTAIDCCAGYDRGPGYVCKAVPQSGNPCANVNCGQHL